MKSFKYENYENQACTKKDTDYKLQLNDCLACSGCITDKDDLITKSKIEDVIGYKDPLSFIVSPQSKWSLYNYFKTKNNAKFTDFESSLCLFLKQHFSIDKIFDSSYATETIGKSLLLETNKIITDCPGTVMYIERQGGHLVDNLSRIPTAQQLLSKYNTHSGYVSVVPCYDKKLEASEKNNNLLFVLTSHEFALLLVQLGFTNQQSSYKCLPHEKLQLNCGKYLKGYLEYVLFERYSKHGSKDRTYEDRQETETININTKLELNKSKDTTMKQDYWNDINHISLSNLKENVQYKFYKKTDGFYLYEFKIGTSVEVYARVIGIENLLNFIKETKFKGLNYRLIEAYICNYGCLNGPGQLVFDDMAATIEGFSKEGKSNDYEATICELSMSELRMFSKKETKKVKFDVKW